MRADIFAEVATRTAPKVTPFSTEDLGRVFDGAVLRRGRSLILLEAVTVSLQDDTITVVVEHLGVRYSASITPSPRGSRVGFLNRCSCGQSACAHAAAGALAALDRFPTLRRPEQTGLLSALAEPVKAGSAQPAQAGDGVLAAGERQRLVLSFLRGNCPMPVSSPRC